ncbi:SMC5-SMC6 complex localization factor protein 1 [Salarias fasciatus]|uniref:SMC5-SMC6 complex localization factor protein 1 n=1 Tax=Salarias fasciatus TaxID=181472 RepID=UPI001176A8C2|nr:SMC5-SMC6 complex localization factor protein 1 [Salarias fasciatus]
MESCAHVFQISGIKTQSKKRLLIQGIRQLGGRYIGGSVYQHESTHLIIPQVLSSEKFLSACAAGKWVVTPDYVLDSVKNGSWLAEGSYEVELSTDSTSPSYPVRKWREKVASGSLTGAFQGWRVLLLVQENSRRGMFNRLLKAGRAEVYHRPPPSHASITHVMAKPVTENSKSHNAPCYPVNHIVQHLFGSDCVKENFSMKEDDPEDFTSEADEDFSNLEKELKNYIIKQEGRPRLCYFEFLGCHAPNHPPTQATETDFSNVGSMIECGLFNEALDSIRSVLFPGVLPPASHLAALIAYAQQGKTTPGFLRNFHYIMENLIFTNPPWLAPSSVKNYFAQVLQCPRCKLGSWRFLQTAVSYCLSREDTCHPLPGPALPTLLDFHYTILMLFMKLFQGEYYSLTAGDFGLSQGTGVPSASSLLYVTIWTVWERSVLLSAAVKQLTQLLMEAAVVDYVEQPEKKKLHMADALLDLFSVLVEFWCQHHIKLNQTLMQKGLKDLSEHLIVVSQDVPPGALAELAVRLRSTRLKLLMTDALLKSVFCSNGITVGDEPLSYRKMVLSYLPLLGSLARSPSGACLRTGSNRRVGKSSGSEANLEKENIPRGFSRVNAAGETLLHRACKRNQVEMVLQILTLPGTDVNVKDHAGWTPLHEACNHGSAECVAALLRCHPAPVIDSQVGGVSPLHDALLNGHMDIAKMLLEHAGSALLQQPSGGGLLPLDMVSTPEGREELLLSAQVGDAALSEAAEAVALPLLEAASTLLAHLIFTYHRERGVPGSPGLAQRLVRAMGGRPSQRLTAGWTDRRAVGAAEDAETLLELSRGRHRDPDRDWAVTERGGEHTAFLMEIVEDLRSRGEALAALL